MAAAQVADDPMQGALTGVKALQQGWQQAPMPDGKGVVEIFAICGYRYQGAILFRAGLQPRYQILGKIGGIGGKTGQPGIIFPGFLRPRHYTYNAGQRTWVVRPKVGDDGKIESGKSGCVAIGIDNKLINLWPSTFETVLQEGTPLVWQKKFIGAAHTPTLSPSEQNPECSFGQ